MTASDDLSPAISEASAAAEKLDVARPKARKQRTEISNGAALLMILCATVFSV